MKLELKNIKYSVSLSEETHAYTAQVYKDGKPFCHVSNHGHGGCDMQHPIAPFTQADIADVSKWLAANMQPIESQYGGPPLVYDLELWCGDQVDKFLIEKDLKKALRSKVLYLDDGKIYETWLKGKRSLNDDDVAKLAASITAKKPGVKVLNQMPFDTALAVFRAAAT